MANNIFENLTDEEQNNLWMYMIFNKDKIKTKTEQWIKEAEMAGMTLKEYLESISPLKESEKKMTYRQNVKAILECIFAGFKDELIEVACERICELKEFEVNKIRDEIEKMHGKSDDKWGNDGTYLNIDFVLGVIDKYK